MVLDTYILALTGLQHAPTPSPRSLSPSTAIFQLPSGYTIKTQIFGGVMGGIVSSPPPAPPQE
jgi:hypothetical protein